MTDIFLSYANEDRDSAARLAAYLESVGWRVWWDRRIPAGRTWRAVLADALSQMRCMIVLWSKHSVESSWVAEEAEEARRLGKALVPVLIERIEPPIGFRAIQAADLTDWGGSPDDPSLQQLVADLKSVLGAPPEPSHERGDTVAPPTKRSSLPQWVTRHWPKASAGGLVILAILAIWLYGPLSLQEPGAPVTENSAGLVDATPAPRLTSLSVRAPRQILKPSETLKLTVRGQFSDGSERDVNDGIEWSSSDTRIAIVDEDGEVRALQAGTSHIVAKIGVLASSGWTLGVEASKATAKPAAPRLVALKVRSDKKELFENEKIALRARAKYSDDSEKELSSEIVWQSSDRAVASVNSRGELRALRPGKVEVVARAQNFSSAPEIFVIKEVPGKTAPQAKPVKTVQPATAKPATLAEPAKAKIVGHLNRAQTYREQGNYAAALAELEQAKTLDGANELVLQEIEKTTRACNAEKVLGNKPSC
jgi:hypothetical protein